jgi:hypothetical protein
MFETEKDLKELASHYDGLFNLMEQEHGLILTISQMDDIIRESQKVVEKFYPDVRDSRTTQPEPIQLAVGRILIAKDVCKMFEDGKETQIEALIIGKEYPIKAIISEEILIDSECISDHYFTMDKIQKFFNIKQ